MAEDTELDRAFDRARADLRVLLPGREELSERLAMLVGYARGATTEHGWWDSSKPRQVRSAARRLVEALDTLDYYERLSLQEVFNARSIDIFRGYSLPKEWAANPRVREFFDETFGDEQKDYIKVFVKQVRFLGTVGTKQIGRPKEEARHDVAVKAALALIKAGIQPAKSNTGVFADVLRIIVSAGGLPVPDSMYPITAQAMREVAERARYDRKLAAALGAAQPFRRSRERRSPVRGRRTV